ncbi:MAG: hypothetical protein KOO60_02675 [Gemmatimonadales bacterium]|nr:hypothetical protein [Gemmatimonadales bacterium]
MNGSLLAKVRIWTTASAIFIASISWFAVSPEFGLGVFLTALWAVAGFWTLEKILRQAARPPGTPRNGFAIALWIVAKLAIYGLAVWVLFSRPLPVFSHVVGFSILMVILVILGANARADEIKKPRQPTEQGDDAQV